MRAMTSVSRQPKARPADQFPAGPVDAKKASHVLVRTAVISMDRCGACSAVLPVSPWRVAEGIMPVCPPCGAARAPELAWVAELLNGPGAGELPVDPNIGIRYSAAVVDGTCVARGWLVSAERRTPIEIARTGSGQRPVAYSVGAAEDAAPALALALHTFYGTIPEPRAETAEPQPEPETAEQAAHRERCDRRDRALDDFAAALLGRREFELDRAGARRRAYAAFNSLTELFAVQEAGQQ